MTDDETLEVTVETASLADYEDAAAVMEQYGDEPDPSTYGIWIPGISLLMGNALEAVGAADWLVGLINDGIVAGVGAVLGFVPQMLVLFLLLAFLEACGYMARIAFVLDRIFRKFGLSGKSFIPMLIGTGCGIPGIMASRTIENERDRRMTIITTTFIPCGAKVPFISMVAGAIFGGSAWVATSAYFVGMAAIIISGIMLKKTKMFSGEPAPFVMELPAYHQKESECLVRRKWISHFLQQLVAQSHGFLYRLAGETGRRQWLPLRVWWQKKISLVQWESSIPADGLKLVQTLIWLQDIPSLYSIFCVRLALRQLVLLNER